MSFSFATCERHRALGFLAKLYPSQTITDTDESAGPLLDLVTADIVRVQDPMMHSPAQVIPGTHWDESYRSKVVDACQLFHRA